MTLYVWPGAAVCDKEGWQLDATMCDKEGLQLDGYVHRFTLYTIIASRLTEVQQASYNQSLNKCYYYN